MANGKKKLQKAATKFRRENPEIYNVCCILAKNAANFINKIGATEVTVGFESGIYYERAND